MEYMQKYVKEQGDTSLCNVNKTVKGPDHPGARVAVKRQEQLGVSSQGAKDLPQGLAEGNSRAATGRGAGRACCREQHKHGRSTRLHDRNGLHQTCRPVNQFEHVCVEECPLTTRHTAAAATAAKSRND